MSDIEWVVVKGFKDKEIGAVGFINNDVVALVSFYEDLDRDKSGDVSFGEKIASYLPLMGVKGGAIAEVAMNARADFDIITRDPSFYQDAVKLWLNYARGLIREGIYVAYFSRGVKMTGKGVAKLVTDSTVKQIVIRKGFEKAAKKAFDVGVSL